MIYKCKNCDGNMIYHVEERKLYCPYCNSLDTEKVIDGKNACICDSCGGELSVGQFDSVVKCLYCSQYVIYKQRVEGEYEPSRILPFKVGKEQAKTMIRLHYRDKRYVPKSFLNQANLEKMEGIYVPFWLFDFNVNVDFRGRGYRERVMASETAAEQTLSCYDVYRNFDASFRKIPADASYAMPDKIMDMLEPYDYGEIEHFNPKYMSGFLSEIYSDEAKNFESRVNAKVQKDINRVLAKHLSSFKTVTPIKKEITVEHKGAEYVLLPVWKYLYTYQGKEYEYYINGQSGKVIGKAPLSIGKAVACGSGIFLGVLLAALLLLSFTLGKEFYVGAVIAALLVTAIYMLVTWPKQGKITTTEKTFLATQRMNDTRDILRS